MRGGKGKGERDKGKGRTWSYRWVLCRFSTQIYQSCILDRPSPFPLLPTPYSPPKSAMIDPLIRSLGLTVMTSIAPVQRPVLWLQVWGLAGMQGAIALLWVIYNLYLPQLLGQFGWPVGVATTLLVVENLMAAVMEPVMGNFSDYRQRWVGSRLPLIALGVILTSAFSMAMPVVAVWGTASVGRMLMPAIAILWALAMTVFRSPMLSLLGRYAFGSGLPRAASVLTLVGALAGAMAPLAGQWILQWGAIATFSLGTFILLAAALVLRWVSPPASPPEGVIDVESGNLPGRAIAIRPLALIFGAGMFVAIGFRLMMQTFPAVLQVNPAMNVGLTLGIIFLAVAVTAIPAGSLAAAIGNRKAMVLGLGVMAVGVLLILVAQTPLVAGGVAIALGSAFSLVSNGTLPFALSLVPSEKAGLGTGMFFSGGAIGTSLFFEVFKNSEVAVGAIVGATAFGLAGLCVMLASEKRGGDR